MKPEKARCQFVCDSIARTAGTTEVVTLCARYDTSIEAEQRFNEATPWGEMKFGLQNPALKGFFEPGKTYYIDITAGD